ncbi:beta strand repeat-containing protein, partial [Pedobacter sp. GSP4]|uniref:beta strand repeat-containing protein n=1 Tax=Pedobacter sp. GSP4 TaxID=3453716 RepID=UPI003EECA86E
MNKNLLSLCGPARNFSRINNYLTNSYCKYFAPVLFLLIVLLFTNVNSAFADGSINLYPDVTNGTAVGGRAKLRSSNTTNASFPFANLGVHYVYAAVNERITMASSAMINGTGSFIRLTRPDGTVVATYNPSAANPAPGQILNRDAEIAGPRRFGQAAGGNRYLPVYYQVAAGETGIFKVEFVAPGGIAATGTDREDITYDDNWTQNTTGTSAFNGDNSASGAIAAWDVSVLNTANSAFIPGRVYTNILTLDLVSSFEDNRSFHSVLNVLTKDGYVYNVDNNGQNGVGFTFFANNRGFTTLAGGAGNTIDKSLNYSTTPPVKNPTTTDDADNITHKIFFTKPSTDLPATATLNGSSTWLRLATPITPQVSNFSFNGVEGSSTRISNKGAYVNFTSSVAGVYKITIPGNGNFIDRVITGRMSTAGAKQVYWDGRAGSALDPTLPGAAVPPGTVVNTIKVQVFSSEVHFPFLDLEVNPKGIIITQTDASYNQVPSKDIVYWDDTDVTLAGNTAPTSATNNAASTISSPKKNALSGSGLSSTTNGHIWGKYTSAGGQGFSDFGNERGLDTYTYIPSAEQVQAVSATISQADLAVQSITPSVSTAKIGTSITYTVVLRNIASSTSVSDVTGAIFNLEYPDGFVVTSATSAVNSGTVSQTATSTTNTKYAATLNMTSGSQVTYTITGTVGAALSNTTVAARATILRQADISDPDATDESTPTFSGNADTECNGSPSGVGCNNIVTASGVVVPATVSIVATTPNAAEPSTNGLFTVNLTSAVAGNTVVNYSIAGSAVNGTDYNTLTPLTGSVTILAGQTSATIPVTVFDDNIVEASESVILTITSVNNTTTPATTTSANSSDLTATVNIADNDSATITVATTDGAEPGTNGSFVFTMSTASSTNTTITYTVGGSATNGTDYATITNTATILAGQTTVTVPVTVTNDQIVEGNETVVLTFTSATNNPSITVTPATATVNIADDDAVTLVLSGPASVNENAGTATYTVTLTGTAGTTIKNAVSATTGVTPGTA